MCNSEYRKIADGVKLLCVNSDKFKTNYITVDFYLPIGEQLAAQNVLSSLMGHTSGSYRTFKDFSAKIESLYGADFDTSIATIGDKVRIRFSVELPDDRFSLDGKSLSEEAVDFLIDIISVPNCSDGEFDKTETEREIRFTLQNIEAEKNDKRAYAVSRLRQLMCAGEPYGIDREKLENDIRALDGVSLFSAYENMLKTAHIAITACGNIEEKMLCDKFTAFLKGIKERQPSEPRTVIVEKADKIRYFKENMDVNQAKMVIGLRTGAHDADDSYIAYKVMTDVFGGGPYSRLFMNVREKLSLCYYCGARLLREKGIIFIQCGVEQQNYEKALNEIINQLDIMKNGEFTDEELTSSVTALSDAYRGVDDSPLAVCTFNASQFFDDKIQSGRELADKIQAVTREEIIACARRVTVDSVYLLAGESAENE